MSKLKEFKEMVLGEESQFEINEGNKVIYFIRQKMGNATLIHSDYVYNENVGLDMKYKLCAIVSDNNIYIVDTFMFYDEKEQYPQGVHKFHDKLKEVNEVVCGEMFKQFYGSLQTRELTENELYNVERQVRSIVMYDKGVVKQPKIEKVISDESLLKIFLGKTSVNELANSYFDKNKERYVSVKSEIEVLERLVAEQLNVDDWELELTQALNNIEAKTVNVEFCVKGEYATEKVDKDTLIRQVVNHSTFSSFNFSNGKSGERLLKKLNMGRYEGQNNGELKCEHITKVTYGKKVVYSK